MAKLGSWNKAGLSECKRCRRAKYMHRAKGLCVSCYNSAKTAVWRKKVAAELKTLRANAQPSATP